MPVTEYAYLDHAATTPVRPDVIAAVAEAQADTGNASALHAAGRRARRRVEESREAVAEALDARPSEIVFTSGGTESDNLAVKGLFWARRAADPARVRVLTGSTEHHAVHDAAHWLAAHEGAKFVTVEADPYGVITPEALDTALGPDTTDVALVSVMWANNEIGTVSPVAELAALAHERGVLVHTDAVQALATLPVSFAASGVDAMAVTGHKLGGPCGVGALVLRRDLDCEPLLHGGGQERDVRSGTLDVAAIVGFAAAVTAAVAERDALSRRLESLRSRLLAGLRSEVPDLVVNGHPTQRLPGLLHVSFPGCEGDAVLMLLDAVGVECSTGSACNAGVSEPSAVLLALGASREVARGSVRFSLGHTSTESDVDAAVAAIGPAVERARKAAATMAAAP
ncbi:cysteine desulfurase family protein [Jatrophihabitans sp. YIM 134969]